MDRNQSLLFRLHIDPPLVGGVLVLAIVGIVVLFSASDENIGVVLRQLARMGIGFVAMITIAQLSPQQLRRAAPVIYVFGLILLVAVFLCGRSGRKRA